MSVRKRLGEMLLDAGVIDETQLSAALGHQKQWGGRLGQALVDLRLATESQIVEALAVKFGFETARIEGLESYGLSQALKLVPREFAVKNNVFPMAADTSSITIAMSDPANVTVSDELRFRTGRKVKVCIGGDREIADAIRKHYPDDHKQVEAIALDLEGGDPVEPVLDAFGGGSRDALEAFFGGPAAPPPGPSAVAPAARPAREPATPGPPAPAAARPAREPATPGPPSAAVARPAPREPATPGPPSAAVVRPAPREPATPPPPARAPAAPRVDLELEEPSGEQPVEGARDQLLGAVPQGGFAQEPDEIAAVPIDDLFTPSPLPLPTAQPPAATRRAPAPQAAGPVAAAAASRSPASQAGVAAPAGGASRQAPAPQHASAPAASAPAPGSAGEGRGAERTLTLRELEILDALESMAHGGDSEPAVVKPDQAMAALVRLMLRKRVITEQEFLEELLRK
ncbi:MAG TPA: hypothetical protein VLU43_11800 [Anaeromyxobacteraceae bacterium]|nr:hypothetical protein [Anaeromyxobacteraceae bacterium]